MSFIERFLSRKLFFSVLTLATSTSLVCFKFISPDDFTKLMVTVASVYLGSQGITDAMEKLKGGK